MRRAAPGAARGSDTGDGMRQGAKSKVKTGRKKKTPKPLQIADLSDAAPLDATDSRECPPKDSNLQPSD